MKSTLKLFKTIACLLSLVIISNKNYSQSGTLDQTFGNGGIVLGLPVQSDVYIFSSIALQQNGKILQNGIPDGFFTKQYTSQGIIDSGFGINGSFSKQVGTLGDESPLHGIALQNDGKIVIGASSYYRGTLHNYQSFSAILIKPNGTLDSSFGNAGVSVSIFDTNNFYQCYAITLQKDNKILLTGGDNFGNFVTLRLTTKGFIDSSFGINGVVKTKPDASEFKDDGAHTITVQPDGKIITAGEIKFSETEDTEDFIFIRYNADGSLDESFGDNGIVTSDLGQAETLNSVLITSEGKIIGVGDKRIGFGFPYEVDKDSVLMIKLNNDGSVDKSFGNNGIFTLGIPGYEIAAFDIKEDNNKNLIVCGGVENSSITNTLLLRLKTTGVLDSSFGTNGIAITNIHGFDVGLNLTIQKDNKILLNSFSFISDSAYANLARYNSDNVLPLSFLSFNATKQNQSVLLNWQTTNEINNNYFSVERSGNNKNFSELNKVYSTNNPSKVNSYNATDVQPLNGWNYYRLKQVDKDGKSSYSSIAAVLFTNEALISIYPNPAKNFIYIDGLKEGHQSTIIITDANGKTVATANSSSSQYKFDLQSQAAGIYYINITQDSKTIKQKFVKQ